METYSEVINLIRMKRDALSKGQKKLADYVIANYDKCAFMTAVELGMQVGVSESTVVRFAVVLGFKGYPQLQKALANVVCDKISQLDRIQIDASDISGEQIIDNVMRADADKILLSLEKIDKNAFGMAVNDILDAENVYIIGIRSCAPLASFLAYYLKLVRKNVYQVESSNTSELFEQMLHVSDKDAVIGISFPRYSMRTLKAMEFANNRNAKVIAITDNKHSPMCMYSSVNLFARSDMASVVDSLVAPLSVINALIVALCIEKSTDVLDNLEMLENVLYNYQFNDNDDINLLNEDAMAVLHNISKDIRNEEKYE